MKPVVVIAIGVVIVLCVGAVAVVVFSSAGKRKPPPKIKPVAIGAVEYRVPNNVETEGVVEAWDFPSGKLLWNQKIYFTWWKLPSWLMEADCQYNFITNITVGPATNELTVANEKGRQYILNTASRKVRKSKW